MFETVCIVITMVLSAISTGLMVWDRVVRRSPILLDYEVIPCYDKNMAQVSMTFVSNKSPAVITEISCPGYKLHSCPRTFTGFSAASLKDFSDSLPLREALAPGVSSQAVSVLISPIPKDCVSIILRIRNTSRPIKYSITAMHESVTDKQNTAKSPK